MTISNRVVASGQLKDKLALRYTPAGIPMIEFRLMHESAQLEAGLERQIQCELPCICLGPKAVEIEALPDGFDMVVKGFMAARSRRWPTSLVLHVVDWKPGGNA